MSTRIGVVSRLVSVAACAAAIVGFAAVTAPTVSGQSGSAALGDGIGTPKFTTDESVKNFSANAETIPYWRSSFTDPTNGVTYPITMVGANPDSELSTVVPTVIIPMSFSFVSSADVNHTLDGTDRVLDTVASPMFDASADIGAAANATASAPPQDAGVAPAKARPVREPSDVTQVGDAIVRAQWGKTGTGYHVLLGQPQVLPTVSFSVPANQGFLIVGSRSHRRIGLMQSSWFSSRLNETMRNLHVSSKVLPIFLVNNVFLYSGTPDNCCTLGYHGATSSLNGNGQQIVNTYMFASYSDQGIFGANAGDKVSYIADIHGLSHEVQEWLDDPFVNNIVNPWLTPTAPQYGCTAFLETGDPVVGFGFLVNVNGRTYHPEDEVHFSWFARESPSRAAQRYFTYLNNFAGVAKGCQ